MSSPKAGRIGDYLQHMVNAIGRTEAYVTGLDQAAFDKSTLVQDAVIRNFEIIGEAANKIGQADPEFVRRHAQLRLDLAYRMRNALIHGYDAVNLVTLWNTIQNDLPVLKQQVAAALAHPG